ncbi:MAG: hypothetical protein KME01_12985 [Chroococcus sp. CMT-3BRIN-NPC107]|jgi:hypothetical protein|nr:hypothetical protein [Chroococcus sp. CMT-3BRIN-NPC107]
MDDSIFIIFIAFGCLWAVMGTAIVFFFFKSDGQQKVQVGKWGLIVALPIVIPMAIAFIYAAVRR